MDLLPLIAEERRRVADWLETLDEAAWDTASCCRGWTVRETAAHMLAGPHLGLRKTFPFMLKARGDLAKANDLVAKDLASKGSGWMVTRMRELADSPFRPPGFGLAAPLTDVTIHGQDMSRPLGADLGVPVERWRTALETAVDRRFAVVSVRKHLQGLRFEADDLDFTSGEGVLVRGNAKDLAHVMWGRPQALDQLTGDGVALLANRLS